MTVADDLWFFYKAKKGSSVTDEDPGRTPFGFIVPRAHKHRYRLQWPLSRKRQRTFPFPLRSLIAESVADTVNFFLCHRLDKHRTLLLIYFLFVPAVAVGSAGGKVILPHGDLQCTEPLHQAAGIFLCLRKIVVDLVEQPNRCFVLVKVRIQLGTQLPGIQREDQRLLHGVFLNFVFHKDSSLSDKGQLRACYSAFRQTNHAMLFRFPLSTSVYIPSSRAFRLETVS